MTITTTATAAVSRSDIRDHLIWNAGRARRAAECLVKSLCSRSKAPRGGASSKAAWNRSKRFMSSIRQPPPAPGRWAAGGAPPARPWTWQLWSRCRESSRSPQTANRGSSEGREQGGRRGPSGAARAAGRSPRQGRRSQPPYQVVRPSAPTTTRSGSRRGTGWPRCLETTAGGSRFTQVAQPSPRLEGGLLHRVLRLVGVVQQSQSESKSHVILRSQELREGATVATLGVPDELGLVVPELHALHVLLSPSIRAGTSSLPQQSWDGQDSHRALASP